MASQNGQLILGALDFMSDVAQGGTWSVEALSEGTTWGNPEPELTTISSFLADGDDVRIDRFGNVEHTVTLAFTGVHLRALAEAEKMLMGELFKRNELIWTPPGGWAESSVMEIVTSWSEFTFDDFDEVRSLPRRTFVINIVRRPWVRSLDPVIIEAQGLAPDPISPTETVITDGSTITGWSTGSNTQMTTDGTYVRCGTTTFPAKGVISYLRPRYDLAAPLDFTAAGTPLLMADWYRSGGEVVGDYRPTCRALVDDGWVDLEVAGEIASPDNPKTTRTWWTVPAGVVAALDFAIASKVIGPWGRYIYFDKISRFNAIPAIGTGGQQFRTIEVPGTAPTEASILIEHETDALGHVLCWTGKAVGGYQPPLSSRQTAGPAPVPTAGTLSGGWTALDGAVPVTYDTPIGAIPRATYAMLAVLKGTAPGGQLVQWDVSTLVGTTKHAMSSGFAHRSLTAGAAIYDLGILSLPTMPAGEDAMVRVELHSDGACQVDEVFLLDITNGRMSLVSCGTGAPSTGGASNRLWIESPTLDTPRPGYYLGTEADQTDRRHATGDEIMSFQSHELAPGTVNVFTATTGVSAATVSAELFPRWRHNAVT